ncbi:hypothetical protein HDV05_003595 [Chytridiales sp. JEL 0842]|nr:hypothetical protein HDV05_003595 [Chytridiales sp. JEL 0842]
MAGILHRQPYSSKGKGGKKASGRGATDDTKANSNLPPFDVAGLSSRMSAVVDRFRQELGGIRIGRANPAILDSINVTHKGSRMPLSQLAQINAKDAQTLMVVLNDEQFTSIAAKAIRDANLGLNPQPESGNVLKVPIPKLNKEYRETLLRTVSTTAEKARSRIRAMRADAKSDLKKKYKDALTGDEMRSFDDKIQKETDKAVKDVDSVAEGKKKEINTA